VNTKDKRNLLKSIVDIIQDVPDEETVRYMYDFQIDKAAQQVFGEIGKEANLEEIFDLVTIKDWICDNFQLLFPSIDEALKGDHYPQKEIDTWVKLKARQFRIDAIFDRKEIESFLRDE
jgi:hypothetical protein